VSVEYGLGALPSPEDERDYQLAEVYAALGIEPVASAALPMPFRVAGPWPPVLKQGNTPTCVSHATSSHKAYQDFRDRGFFPQLDEFEFARRINTTAAGAYVRWAMAELVRTGYPEAGGANAAAHRSKAFYAIPTNPDGLQAAVVDFGPIVIAGPWYRSWFNPGPGGVLPAPDTKIGGHALEVDGYNAVGIEGPNSWGPHWGDHGRFTLPWRHVGGLWEAWKAIDVPPPPIAWRIHLAHGAQIRRYVLDAAGRITGWTDELWQFAASSAPCEEPVKRRTANGRSTALTVRVIRGKYAGQILAASRLGVTVKAI